MPDHKATKTHCADCLDRGFLWFKRANKYTGRFTEYVVRCASCENWRDHVSEKLIPAASRYILESQGLPVFPYDSK